MKKKSVAAAKGPNNGPVHLAAVETEVLGEFPHIIAHCSVVRYDDGEPRQPGWLVTRTLGASWQIVAKDPDAGAQLSSVGPTHDDALAGLELLLGSDDAPWEVDKWLSQGKAKKK